MRKVSNAETAMYLRDYSTVVTKCYDPEKSTATIAPKTIEGALSKRMP